MVIRTYLLGILAFVGLFTTAPLNADPLHDAATQGDIEEVNRLIAQGVDVNAIGHRGATAIHLASGKGYLGVVRALLAAGAEIDQHDTLFVAAYFGHAEVLQVLLDNGADVDYLFPGGYTALIHASLEGHAEVVQVLLDNGAETNRRDTDGTTALDFAAQKAHEGIVQALLDSGADINYKDPQNGTTALIMASQHGAEGVVKILIAEGAELDHQANNGTTALFLASFMGHEGTVRTLLAARANVNLRESGGGTALTYAQTEEIKQLLREAGATSADVDTGTKGRIEADEDPRLADQNWPSSISAPPGCAWICTLGVCEVDHDKPALGPDGEDAPSTITGIRYSGIRIGAAFGQGTKVNLTPYQLESENGWQRQCGQ